MCTELDNDKIILTCVTLTVLVTTVLGTVYMEDGPASGGVKVGDKLQLIVLSWAHCETPIAS